MLSCRFSDNVSTVCNKLVALSATVVLECNGVQCDCPPQPYNCPTDAILVENRIDNCCVTYECVCPSISCPLLMESGQGVQPVPNYRGNQFPGRCCPDYSFEGENIIVSRRATKKKEGNRATENVPQ